MNPATIVVVDDSDDVREILEIMLSHAGYIVHTFASPVDASEALGNMKVDMFLIDLVMPIVSGMDFVQALDVKNSDYEVIIMTGKTDRRAVLDTLAQGACSYVLKPFKYEDLLAKVKEALEAVRAKRLRMSTSEQAKPLPV